MPALAEISRFETPSNINTLDQAREAVLQLPGVEHYVSQWRPTPQERDKDLEKMTSEVLDHIDSENMAGVITNFMGWADDEEAKTQYFKENVPFKSKIELSPDFNQRLIQFHTIGRYLHLKYADLKGKDGAEKAKSDIKLFCNYSMQNLFQPFAFDLQDKIYGIDPEKRRAGTLTQSTDEMKALFEEETRKVADRHKKDPQALIAEVYEATDKGNFAAIPSILWNNTPALDVREALEAIYEKRLNDPELTVEQLKILWAAEVYQKLLGIDTETYYEINDQPPGSELQANVLKFINDSEGKFIPEVKQHIEEEAPGFLDLPDGQKTFFNLLAVRAKHLKLPATRIHGEKLEDRRKDAQKIVNQLFPPSKLVSQAAGRFSFSFPDRLGAFALRPVTISFFDQKSQLVIKEILNPHEAEDHLPGRIGHELAHAIHLYIADLLDQLEAKASGKEPRKSFFRTPGAVREIFSQMLESQISTILKSQKAIPIVDFENWGDLQDAVITRRQAPYALIQRAARLEMEKIWQEGYHGWLLPEAHALNIMQTVGLQAKAWYKKDFPGGDARMALLNNIHTFKPYDGSDYLSRGNQDVKKAFKKLYGPLCFQKQDARAVFIALIIHSRDHNKKESVAGYPDFIAAKKEDIVSVYADLEKLGITKEYI